MLDENRPPVRELNFWQAIARPGFVKFFIAFVILVFLVMSMYWYFGVYKKQADAKRAAADYMEYRRSIFQADRFGGTTPLETLEMFIKALEAGDAELATMYFEPNDDGSREQYRRVLVDTYNAGNFPAIVEALRHAQADPHGIIGEYTYRYVSFDENGELLVYLDLIYNGDIWRIDSI